MQFRDANLSQMWQKNALGDILRIAIHCKKSGDNDLNLHYGLSVISNINVTENR
jgi:hypothetical protein